MRRVVVLSEPGVVDALGAASALGEAIGLEVIAVGNLCRDAVQGRTRWGQRIDEHLQAGELVPDELIAGLVRETLAGATAGWVLFGYPRTVPQAELLADHGHGPDTVVEIVLTDRQLDHDRRLAERRHVLQEALAEYRQQAAPLHAFYRDRGAFQTLEAFGHFEDIATQLLALVSR
jgi:adenylate kinase family enzyme